MPKSLSERPETQVTPEPALEKRTRRQFTPEYKLRILAKADACKHGERFCRKLIEVAVYDNQQARLFRNCQCVKLLPYRQRTLVLTLLQHAPMLYSSQGRLCVPE